MDTSIFVLLHLAGARGEPERCPVNSPEDGDPAGSKGEALRRQDQGATFFFKNCSQVISSSISPVIGISAVLSHESELSHVLQWWFYTTLITTFTPGCTFTTMLLCDIFSTQTTNDFHLSLHLTTQHWRAAFFRRLFLWRFLRPRWRRTWLTRRTWRPEGPSRRRSPGRTVNSSVNRKP